MINPDELCMVCTEDPSNEAKYNFRENPITRKLVKAVPVTVESFVQLLSTLKPEDGRVLSLAKKEEQIWCLACQHFICCEFFLTSYLYKSHT